MPIKMNAIKSHRYGTRQLTAGEEYEVSGESHARLYSALGYATRSMSAAPAPAPAPAPEAPKKWARKPAEPKPAEAVGTPNPDPDKPTEPVDHSGLVSTVRRYARRNLTPSSED